MLLHLKLKVNLKFRGLQQYGDSLEICKIIIQSKNIIVLNL